MAPSARMRSTSCGATSGRTPDQAPGRPSVVRVAEGRQGARCPIARADFACSREPHCRVRHRQRHPSLARAWFPTSRRAGFLLPDVLHYPRWPSERIEFQLRDVEPSQAPGRSCAWAIPGWRARPAPLLRQRATRRRDRIRTLSEYLGHHDPPITLRSTLICFRPLMNGAFSRTSTLLYPRRMTDRIRNERFRKAPAEASSATARSVATSYRTYR
jgi:hypothetical protein